MMAASEIFSLEMSKTEALTQVGFKVLRYYDKCYDGGGCRVLHHVPACTCMPAGLHVRLHPCCELPPAAAAAPCSCLLLAAACTHVRCTQPA